MRAIITNPEFGGDTKGCNEERLLVFLKILMKRKLTGDLKESIEKTLG